ncbi:contactin [Hetaerina americana]|uniref:contactin n=1 Tax=Hetaerina americana TaxID=62018 RepID=UPI003A7F2B25
MKWLTFCIILVSSSFPVYLQRETELQCPEHWVEFQSSCYRFIKSPLRSRNEARKNCQAYDSDLASVGSLEEHGFLVHQLLWRDPQHRRWYFGAHQQSAGYWVNEGDSSQLINMDAAFLPDQENVYKKDFLAYSFSESQKKWGFLKVSGDEPLLYICEALITRLHYLAADDRTYQYGFDAGDPRNIPRGPYFIKQPVNVVFDSYRNSVVNDVAMSCLAGGYPTPTYEWFREDYESDLLVSRKIDPLADSRYTVSGGTLLINNPYQDRDRGTYHCKASNRFGSIISESVVLTFGSIGEFNLKRSPESGNQNWGKALYCDPPTYFPSVSYYWMRDFFPNFVEEDKRVFSSYDGYLYFSSLETIDKGNYSCTVQNNVSNTGRNGPFFSLTVNSHSNYQQLKFPNNFPKAFPEAPVAGQEVRLECVAFGYPVPSYNWTRKGSSLPRSAITANYNRVLILPKVQVEDQGEYVCRVFNDKAAIENSVLLSIQAEPNFTIPLTDKHMDSKSSLTWTCEAFGIPDVTYTWYRNGEILDMEKISGFDKARYHIQDNVLKINELDPERDQGMYQCSAKNQLRNRYSSAQLRVLSLKPSFKKKPLELETYAAEGGNVTIKCNPEAAPRPKFVWKKDGNVLGAGGRRRILENGNLIISPVSRDDEGVYTCTASNMYGSDESKGRLIVLRGPKFSVSLNPRVITSVNEHVKLSCEAYSEEILDMAYIWRHNGLRIRDDGYDTNERIKIDGGDLHILNASLAEAGEYECIVKSAVGRISSATLVLIQGPPGPPGGVKVVDIMKTSATIQWTDGASNGRPITKYIISGRTNWNTTWYNISEGVVATEVGRYNGRKEAVIRDVLSPWSKYEFRVIAGNEIGYGIPSAPSPQYNTPTDHPYKAPTNVGGGGGKIGDLTITWQPLSIGDQNGPGIFYKIFWRRKGDIEFQTSKLKPGNVGMSVEDVSHKYYYTQYEVKVQAGNEVGYGPESEIAIIYSAEDMPRVAPSQVSARSYNSTALNVSWIPIEQTRERVRGKLIGHRLKYWKEDGKEEDSVYYLSRSTKPWSLIVGLQPDTNYYVKVMAYNAAGEGPESERFLERTYMNAPQKPPSSVHIYEVDPSTVRVVWRYVAPSQKEEPLIGYKVRVWEVDQDMSTANDTIIKVGNKLEAYINGLSPGKVYHMRVLAFSNGGDGRMSSPTVTFQMGDLASLKGGSSSIYSFSMLSLPWLIFLCLSLMLQ